MVILGGILPSSVRVLHHFVAWLQAGGCSVCCSGVQYGMILGGICPHQLWRVLHHFVAWLQAGGCSAGGGGVQYGMILGGILHSFVESPTSLCCLVTDWRLFFEL